MREDLRNGIARLFRTAPHFRGKSRFGAALGELCLGRAPQRQPIVQVNMRDGSQMILDARSRTEHWAIWSGDYAFDVISKLAAALPTGCVVLDIGAHVGFFSVPLGRQAKELKGRVYAFEPVRANFERLMRILRLNNLHQTVRALNTALGAERGSIELVVDHASSASTGNAVMVRGDADTSAVEGGVRESAEIKRLDDVAHEMHIDACHLIKIDVEGAELMVFRGAAAFLRRHRPIIYGEFNAHWMKQFGHSFLDVAKMLLPWGYTIFREVDRRRFVPVSEPVEGLENVLLVPHGTCRRTLSALGIQRPI